MLGFYAHGKNLSGYMKCMVFLNHQRQTYLPIKNSIPQNQVVSVILYIPLHLFFFFFNKKEERCFLQFIAYSIVVIKACKFKLMFFRGNTQKNGVNKTELNRRTEIILY
jgi:glycopeptide antibiotics resistance protein